MKILSSADLYSHRYIELLLPLMCLVYMLQPLSSQSSAPPHVQPQSIATNLQAWEHWKTEKGWPLDRRLIKRVSVWQAKITISDLLAEAQKQTKVKLSAKEPELQGHQLTVFAKHLPLNALMYQLSRLLGLFWYQRERQGQIEYIITYGSSPPKLQAEAAQEERSSLEQSRRAMRIVDYIEALGKTEEQLRELAKTDPMLAGSMLRSSATRAGAEILANMPPELLRSYVEKGHVFLGVKDLPAWAEQALRANYRTQSNPPFGLSEDAFVERYRIGFSDRGQYTYKDSMIYDMMGGEWQGLAYFSAAVLDKEEAKKYSQMGEPEWWPKDYGAIGYLPILPLGEESRHLHIGTLPGKGDAALAQERFPDLVGAA
jgi:hypothetical protein